MNAIKNINPNVFIVGLPEYETLFDMRNSGPSTLYWQSKYNSSLSSAAKRVSIDDFYRAEIYFEECVLKCNTFSKDKADIDFINGLLAVIQKRKAKEYIIRKTIGVV